MDLSQIKKEIIDDLKPLNPHKVILFGSFAYGEPLENSDIDLYVVTDDENFPRNYMESMEIKLKISRALENIRKKIDIDLVVHTKAMEKKFLEINSLFAKKIFKDGIVLYENINR